jgi:hypothetical protein
MNKFTYQHKKNCENIRDIGLKSEGFCQDNVYYSFTSLHSNSV